MEAEVISASDKSYSIGIFDLALWLAHRTASPAFVTTNLPPEQVATWAEQGRRFRQEASLCSDPRFADLLRRMNLQP